MGGDRHRVSFHQSTSRRTICVQSCHLGGSVSASRTGSSINIDIIVNSRDSGHRNGVAMLEANVPGHLPNLFDVTGIAN